MVSEAGEPKPEGHGAARGDEVVTLGSLNSLVGIATLGEVLSQA